jgi:hypothetical protein
LNSIAIEGNNFERKDAEDAKVTNNISPHFSLGSREQAQDEARLSHQMDEPSLDL